MDEKLHFHHIMPLWILGRSKCWNCNKSTFKRFIWIILQLFGEAESGLADFIRVIFNLNDQPCSGQPSNVEDALLAIMENKLDISTAFHHLQRLGFKKNSWFWQIKKISFYFPLWQCETAYCKTDLTETSKVQMRNLPAFSCLGPFRFTFVPVSTEKN